MAAIGWAIGLISLAGCGKKAAPAAETAPAPAPENQAPADAAAPAAQTTPERPSRPTVVARDTVAPVAPAPLPAESQALVGAVHGFMTQQLHIFVQQYGRLPQSFGEFTSARMDSVPRPPEGTRYVIDTNAMVVRVVRK